MGMRAVSPHPLPAPGGRGEVGESHHFDRMGMRERSGMHYLTTGLVTQDLKTHDSMNFQVTPWSYGMFCKVRRCERI